MMFGLSAMSQQMQDYSTLFKMQLFMNNWVVYNDRNYDVVVKTDTLFMVINRNMKVTLHSLKTEGFPDGLLFFEVDAEEDIKYNDKPDYLIKGGCCGKYVFCIDTFEFTLYRISGFENSDFLYFLDKYEWQWKLRPFTIGKFIEKYKVEGVDFKCLYNGLRDGRLFDKYKYPCLKRVGDPVTIH